MIARSAAVQLQAAGMLAERLRIREAIFVGVTFVVRKERQSVSHVILKTYVIRVSLGVH
jgi:hypothetical protein